MDWLQCVYRGCETMKDSIMYTVRAYRDYNETGMYMALFFCALIYLWYTYHEREKRFMWIYPSLILMMLIWNPVIANYLWSKIFDYASAPRLYWLFPSTCIIGMAMAQMVGEKKKIIEKVFLCIVFAAVLILCGKFKYSNEYTAEAGNAYNIPQEAVDIADYALARTAAPKLLVPMELATCMRTYSADIRLLYGENATYGRIEKIEGTEEYKVYMEMIKESPDIISANGIIQDLHCDYVVFDSEFHKDYKDLEECGYHYAGTFGKYYVYEDDNIR